MIHDFGLPWHVYPVGQPFPMYIMGRFCGVEAHFYGPEPGAGIMGRYVEITNIIDLETGREFSFEEYEAVVIDDGLYPAIEQELMRMEYEGEFHWDWPVEQLDDDPTGVFHD